VQTRRYGNGKAVSGQQSVLVLLKIDFSVQPRPIAARPRLLPGSTN
jgi:hypothetical protein